MVIEEEVNPRVTERKRNKREAKEYKKFCSPNPWDTIPIWVLLLIVIGLLFLVF
jgi:hypothetical protein